MLTFELPIPLVVLNVTGPPPEVPVKLPMPPSVKSSIVITNTKAGIVTGVPSQFAVQLNVNSPKFSLEGKLATVLDDEGEIDHTSEKSSVPLVAVKVCAVPPLVYAPETW
jgi:hypothetical protein